MTEDSFTQTVTLKLKNKNYITSYSILSYRVKKKIKLSDENSQKSIWNLDAYMGTIYLSNTVLFRSLVQSMRAENLIKELR
jgi:hypothetical protein